MQYIIYTDESVQRGRYHSNFYGGALVRSTDLEVVKQVLVEEKARLGLQEIKWTKVSATYLDKYIAMIKLFFDFPYRHWKFVPGNWEYDESKTKP